MNDDQLHSDVAMAKQYENGSPCSSHGNILSATPVFRIELGKRICSLILPSGFFASFASSRLTTFSLIRQCFVIFELSVVKYFAVSPVFHNLSGHPGKRKKAELSVAASRQSTAACPPLSWRRRVTVCLPTAATRFDFWLFFRFLNSYFLNLNSLRKPALSLT
jgi:hypothetical protein